ncbi:MAG: hypothetical protein AAF193_05115 [Bacteroidota bacterium]
MTESMTWENMPNRNGEKPATTDTNPHTQLNQQPMDLVFINELSEWAFQLTKINRRPSAVSVPGAMAMWMEEEHSCTKCNAFMVGTEFAHFHPHPDYSLHLGLPKKDAEAMISKGWGEWHPLIARGFLPPNIVMLYAPRNEEEMEVAKIILNRSYEFAQGKIKE